jgi:phosphoserine phosphatase RsbU/P
MPFRLGSRKLDNSAGAVRRALHYAFYDWRREMPTSTRIVTYVGIILQGYAFYLSVMWAVLLAFRLPHWLSSSLLLLPRHPASVVLIFVFFYLGSWIQNATLTSEFLRKTQLETDQLAARQVQQTLQPQTLEPLSGYELEAYFKPLREVGGDYFDVIDLPANHTLFALADVSGKGMPAALLAANIQALVRGIASVQCNPVALAVQMNKHLSRYTPIDRFATAVFLVLNRDSGELIYVNAGHNAPILFSNDAPTFLEATGLPLGLFPDARYEARTLAMPPASTLLLFTDGLPDSIHADRPESRLCHAFAETTSQTMANLQALVDPKFNEDDVTILLLKRLLQGS